jgi:hypothetical protein
MDLYYDKNGKPLDLMTAARLFGNPDYKKVARTELGFSNGTVCVSTVWIMLDHNFFGGKPLIFETMVFGGRLDQFQLRYSTEAEALAGHAMMVDAVRLDRSVRKFERVIERMSYV